jgi:hypothetical protein
MSLTPQTLKKGKHVKRSDFFKAFRAKKFTIDLTSFNSFVRVLLTVETKMGTTSMEIVKRNYKPMCLRVTISRQL